MFFKKAKEERKLQEYIDADNRMRSRFSEWSNTRQRKTDTFSLYNHSQHSSKSWPIWDLIYKMTSFTTLNSFEFIYKNCPEVKSRIDKLVSANNYDVDKARKAIVYYGLGLFRMAKYVSNSQPMTPEQIGDFIKDLKLDSAGRQCVADESDAVFLNLKQRYRARKRGEELEPATFYVPYILALANLEFVEIAEMKSLLLSPFSEAHLEHNALVTAESMGDIVSGPFEVLYR